MSNTGLKACGPALQRPGGQTRPYKAPVSLAKGEREFAYYIRKGSLTVRARYQD